MKWTINESHSDAEIAKAAMLLKGITPSEGSEGLATLDHDGVVITLNQPASLCTLLDHLIPQPKCIPPNPMNAAVALKTIEGTAQEIIDELTKRPRTFSIGSVPCIIDALLIVQGRADEDFIDAFDEAKNYWLED